MIQAKAAYRSTHTVLFFNNLWKTFGITNIAVHPIKDQSTNAEMPLIIFYNPFLAHQYSNASDLVISTGGLGLRRSVVDRFRNMHVYPLKTLVVNHKNVNIGVENATKVTTLGVSPTLLFGQILKGYLNASLDVYMVVNYHTDRDSMDKGTVTPIGEVLNGNSDHFIPWVLHLIQSGPNMFKLYKSAIVINTYSLFQNADRLRAGYSSCTYFSGKTALDLD